MGILGDFIYAKTSSLSSTPRGILFSTATADLEESIGTFLLEYRPFEVKWGFIDLLAGARGLCDYAQLASAGKPSSGPRHHRYVSWVDTIIGLKGRIRISHWFSSMPTATWEDSERDRNSAAGTFGFRYPNFQIVCHHRRLSRTWIQLSAERRHPRSHLARSLRRH